MYNIQKAIKVFSNIHNVLYMRMSMYCTRVDIICVPTCKWH